jgi:hypothetical protein
MQSVVDVLVGFAQLIDAMRENPAVRDGEEAHLVVTEACRFYAAASPDDRAQLRKLLPSAIHTQIIEHFAPHVVASFAASGDPAALHLALVALSLDDRAGDFHKTRLYLRDLYVSAVRAQIDPMPYFRAVAALSNATDYLIRGGHRATWHDTIPFQLYLTFFEQSLFFQDEVTPQLATT